jgi:tetratricopeptide (TPR) repeat protein
MRKMLALGPAVGRNDVSRIEAICAEALETDPRDFMALMILADTHWRNKQPDRALPLALKAVALDPDDVHALRIVAGVYAERGAHEAAYPFAKRLANAKPSSLSPAKTASRILAPFTWIAKVRRLNERVRKDEAESKTSYAEWAQWAKGYVSWYEASSRSAP